MLTTVTPHVSPITHPLCPPPIRCVNLPFAAFPAFPPVDLFPHHFALCLHSILQIIPHHPIPLYLFPTLPSPMMKNLVTLSKGPLNPPAWCPQPPPSLCSLCRLCRPRAAVPRPGSAFPRRLRPSLALQPQGFPPRMLQLPRVLISLPLHLHPVSIKQVTLTYLFYLSPSVIELRRVFICFLGLYFSLAKRSNTWAIK